MLGQRGADHFHLRRIFGKCQISKITSAATTTKMIISSQLGTATVYLKVEWYRGG
jgi:hypothetical protein